MKEFHLYGPVTENKYMTVNTTAGNNNNKYKIAETSKVTNLRWITHVEMYDDHHSWCRCMVRQSYHLPLIVIGTIILYRVGQKTRPLCFMVCIFRNSNQIGTKFGMNQSHFIVNIVT